MRSALITTGVLLFACGLHALVLGGLDLSDLPGPASAQLVKLALVGPNPSWELRLLRTWMAASGQDSITATRQVLGLFGLAGLLGVMLLGRVFGGLAGAACAGLVATLWSPYLLTRVLVGLDPIAGGTALLGLGLLFRCVRRGDIPGLALAFPAGALLALGVGVKATALPLLALALLLPFSFSTSLAGSLGASLLGLAGAWCYRPFPGFAWRYVLDRAGDSRPIVPTALDPVLLERVAGESFIVPLLGLALAGALLPGSRQRERLLLAVLSGGILFLVARSLGPQLQPRFLVLAAVGPCVLAGVALARITRLPRGLGWILTPGILACFFFDSMAFLGAFSATRERHVGTEASHLPPAPHPFDRAYANPRFDASLSTWGGSALLRIGQEAPAAGVMGVPLSDSREVLLELGALMSGRPALNPGPERCCVGGRASVACAERVIEELDASGTRLVLPTRLDDDPEGRLSIRVDRRFRSWEALLRERAEARRPMASVSPWWDAWDGKGGGGGELACRETTRVH
jgi:hypothetical protein